MATERANIIRLRSQAHPPEGAHQKIEKTDTLEWLEINKYIVCRLYHRSTLMTLLLSLSRIITTSWDFRTLETGLKVNAIVHIS